MDIFHDYVMPDFKGLTIQTEYGPACFTCIAGWLDHSGTLDRAGNEQKRIISMAGPPGSRPRAAMTLLTYGTSALGIYVPKAVAIKAVRDIFLMGGT